MNEDVKILLVKPEADQFCKICFNKAERNVLDLEANSMGYSPVLQKGFSRKAELMVSF